MSLTFIRENKIYSFESLHKCVAENFNLIFNSVDFKSKNNLMLKGDANPFKERSNNHFNVKTQIESMYSTAEGFGKQAIPKNKGDSKQTAKDSKEN
jgi:hypothetical protein